MMRVLLVGHGRMGKLVESLAPEFGALVTAVASGSEAESALREDNFGKLDVAIDFTVGTAVPRNLPLLAERGLNVVIGTTGWAAHERELRDLVAKTGIGVLAAANFSLGLNLFQ